MFVRTPRLTMRPAWPEDAPALAQAIGHECVVRNLAYVPWPYTPEAAETFARSFGEPAEAKFLVFEHVRGDTRLIGCSAVEQRKGAPHEFGYWFTPEAWGRGYATEAGAAVLRAAKAAGVRHVTSGHFADNPASGSVLRKLGFRPTGRTEPLYSRARGGYAPAVRFALDLEAGATEDVDPDARMAA